MLETPSPPCIRTPKYTSRNICSITWNPKPFGHFSFGGWMAHGKAFPTMCTDSIDIPPCGNSSPYFQSKNIFCPQTEFCLTNRNPLLKGWFPNQWFNFRQPYNVNYFICKRLLFTTLCFPCIFQKTEIEPLALSCNYWIFSTIFNLCNTLRCSDNFVAYANICKIKKG